MIYLNNVLSLHVLRMLVEVARCWSGDNFVADLLLHVGVSPLIAFQHTKISVSPARPAHCQPGGSSVLVNILITILPHCYLFIIKLELLQSR